jgi:UDP-N-acetylglucosamine--N-acetylmuramyl-(pentapeptide) pyrophosphoryl-undecaprenol N-acetylglucosamine transferase
LHLYGKGQTDDTVRAPGYVQVEYIQDELPDVLTMTDLVVFTGGSKLDFRIFASPQADATHSAYKSTKPRRPNSNRRIVPQSRLQRRTSEENLTAEELVSRIDRLYDDRQAYIRQMETGAPHTDAIANVIHLIKRAAKQH